MVNSVNRTEAEIRDWMVTYLANLLGMEPEEISSSTSFEAYGLDSTAAAGFSADLGDFLGIQLEANMAYELPTINAVVEYLMERLQQGA